MVIMHRMTPTTLKFLFIRLTMLTLLSIPIKPFSTYPATPISTTWIYNKAGIKGGVIFHSNCDYKIRNSRPHKLTTVPVLPQCWLRTDWHSNQVGISFYYRGKVMRKRLVMLFFVKCSLSVWGYRAEEMVQNVTRYSILGKNMVIMGRKIIKNIDKTFSSCA